MKNKRKSFLLFIFFALIVIVLALFTVYVLQQLKTGYPLEEPEEITEEYLIGICQPKCNEPVIYHPNYWLCYSEEHEQAKWVATVLSADRILLPTVERSDKFIKDPDIAGGSAVTGDYTGSGYDRGHLLSFASNGWNEEVGNASFYMSNMSPQKPNTNRYTYERIEEAERSATVQNGLLCVVHGPILTDGPYKVIGKSSSVSVPNYYFVCFLDYEGPEKKAIGFIVPNDDVNYKDITQFACSIDDVEAFSGLDFWPLLPDETEAGLEESYDVSLWDLGSFNRDRLAKKYGYDLQN